MAAVAESIQNVGAAWAEFYKQNIDPLLNIVIAVGFFVLVGLVVARIFAPLVTRLRKPVLRRTIADVVVKLVPHMGRSTKGKRNRLARWRLLDGAERTRRISRLQSQLLRAAGYLGLIAGALYFVLSVRQDGAIIQWPAIAIMVVACVALTIGVATRATLDVTVILASGAGNAAWTSELVMQMRAMNADDPHGRVEVPSGSDVNDVIAVAADSDQWLVQLLRGALKLLFNLRPWRLEVTILDERSAMATLHRNGYLIETAQPRLSRSPRDVEHPSELLILAAAFAVVTMAKRYSDITGLYGSRGWQGIGLLNVALSVDGIARRAYLGEAIEEDPRNVLIEYEDVYERFSVDDEDQLIELIDRLEPMIRLAAVYCGLSDRFADQPKGPMDPDPHPVAEQVAATGESDGQQILVDLQPWHDPMATKNNEPRMLLLRLLSHYSSAVRNWSMKTATDKGPSDEQLKRSARFVALFVEQLGEVTSRERRTAGLAIQRMEARAVLCHQLLERELTARKALASYISDEDRTRLALWKITASTSEYMEVRYAYACFLARTVPVDPVKRADTVKQIAGLLNRLCWVPLYKEKALTDPELANVHSDPQVRKAVLQPMRDGWDIQRFSEVRARLSGLGLRSPASLSRSFSREYLAGALQIDQARAESILDAARMLDALLRVSGFEALDEECRIRAARCLIDELGHTTMTLGAATEVAPDGTMAALRQSVYWQADDDEDTLLTNYLKAVVAHLASVSWQWSGRMLTR